MTNRAVGIIPWALAGVGLVACGGATERDGRDATPAAGGGSGDTANSSSEGNPGGAAQSASAASGGAAAGRGGHGGAGDSSAGTGAAETSGSGGHVAGGGPGSGGSQASMCPSGQTRCDGVCVWLDSNTEHCGECAQACAPGTICVDAECECPAGYRLCDSICIDLQSDPRNCGQCGMVCSPAAVCSLGACNEPCSPGLTLCAPNCVDASSNSFHCGACDNACQPGFSCSNGECICAEGRTVCGEVCADLATDPANCGGCGIQCCAGAVCSLGYCTMECPAGLTLCGGSAREPDCSAVCADLLSDTSHCGACDNRCPADAVCVDAVCVDGSAGAAGAGGVSAGGSAGAAGNGGASGSGCVELAHSDFENFVPELPGCPIDPSLSACASADEGAFVARSNECLLAGLEAHDCTPRSHDFTFELVVVCDPFGGCNWPIVVDSVLDCGDHVQLDYSVVEPCASCDALIQTCHILHLPNDPKPVRANATLKPEDCAQ